LRDGVPELPQRASQGRWHTARFADPCLALFSYPLYKSSRAAKISGDRNHDCHGSRAAGGVGQAREWRMAIWAPEPLSSRPA